MLHHYKSLKTMQQQDDAPKPGLGSPTASWLPCNTVWLAVACVAAASLKVTTECNTCLLQRTDSGFSQDDGANKKMKVIFPFSAACKMVPSPNLSCASDQGILTVTAWQASM